MRRIVAAGALAALTVAGVAGCSSVNTAPDQVALHYAAGGFTSQKFESCVAPGTRGNAEGIDELFYYYPVGQRTFKFSTDPGSDAPALVASTKDQQEIVVRGTITFTLNTSCDDYTDSDGRKWPGGKLQKFHETIGRKYAAAATEENKEPPAGWDKMLSVYIRDIVDRAVDNQALTYGWEQLYNDAAKKARWEKDVVKAIPELVKAQAGEDFFTINNVVLQKPDIDADLKAQLTAKQAAILRGQAAEQDKLTAKSWPGGIGAYNEYQRNLSTNKAIEKGLVKILPVPQGSSVIVGGN